MLRSVGGKTLFEQRRAIAWWSFGTLVLVVIIFLYYPSVRDNPELTNFFEDLPPAVQALSGGVGIDFASPAGYLNSQLFFNMVPLIFIIYGVVLGSGAIGREEDRGTAELLLTAPVSRPRVVAEKALASLVLLIVLGAALMLSLLLGREMVGMEISADKLLAASVGSVLIGSTFGGMALAISAALGSRAHAGAIAGAVAFAAFLLYSLAPVVPSLDGWDRLSAFYWYLGSDSLTNGFNLGHLGVLAGASVVLAAAATWLFDRRDVYVA